MKNGRIKQDIYISAILLMGFVAAAHLNKFFKIELSQKSLSKIVQPTPIPAPDQTKDPAKQPIAAISVARLSMLDDRYQRAVAHLATAVQDRSVKRPAVVDSRTGVLNGWIIQIEPLGEKQAHPTETESPEAFVVKCYSCGSSKIIAVSGNSSIAEIYGAHWLADEIQAGISDAELLNLDRTITPASRYRLVDLGGVGIVPEPAAWGSDYLHNSHAFQDVLLPRAPYVDEVHFNRVFAQFKEYLHRMLAYGYNGIVFDGFLEFINFDLVGDGNEIYGPNSEFRLQHLAARRNIGEMFDYAHRLGFKVFLGTDMVPLTPPLEKYLDQRFGGINASDGNFWMVYRLGMEELFDAFPHVDGVMIRTGEAGAVYNVKGWDYYSALSVRTVEATRTMLRELLKVAARKDREIIFRNWSVGAGETGDMHINPETYDRIFHDLNSSHLIVSTKAGKGDFFSYLPLNPTLMTGKQRRLVEVQARREFEGFGAIPNYLGATHQSALTELGKRNPNIEGIWLWTQRGGPLRAGPLSLYPFYGFWNLIDANVYVTARLAWDPHADLSAVTETWVKKNFGDNPQTVDKLTKLLFLSHQAVLKGLYIGGSARKQIVAFGLEPPPTPWMWDIVSGSNSALSIVYLANRDNLEEAVEEGFEAVQIVRQMEQLAKGVELSAPNAQHLHAMLMKSLKYEEDLFTTLAWYRKTFLSYYHWLDTGDPASFDGWEQSMRIFGEKKREHLAKYGADLDFPAYNFFAADAGMAHAQRSETMTWLARLVMVFSLAAFGLGGTLTQKMTPRYPGKAGLRALHCALAHSREQCTAEQISSADCLAVSLPFVFFAGSVLIFSSFASIYYPLLLLASLTVFLFALLLYAAPGNAASSIHLLSAIAAPLLCATIVFMGVISIRGPLYFWYHFWTNPMFRLMCFGLLFAGIFWACLTVQATLTLAFDMGAWAALGGLFFGLGAVLTVGGSIIRVAGLEKSLTALNNEMAILPLSLSKVLGITTHLNIDPNLPIYMVVSGVILLFVGFGLRNVPQILSKSVHVLSEEPNPGVNLAGLSKHSSDGR